MLKINKMQENERQRQSKGQKQRGDKIPKGLFRRDINNQRSKRIARQHTKRRREKNFLTTQEKFLVSLPCSTQAPFYSENVIEEC